MRGVEYLRAPCLEPFVSYHFAQGLPFRFHRSSQLMRKRAIRAVLVALGLCVINCAIKEKRKCGIWIFIQKRKSS